VTEKSGRIDVRPSDDGEILEICVTGVLGLDLYREFRAAYVHQLEHFTRYCVNLRGCEHIDSSGLGVLLILRDYTGLDRERLTIAECSPEVRRLLSFASFEQLFTITAAPETSRSEESVSTTL
jgi:anti-anti-sigma factor